MRRDLGFAADLRVCLAARDSRAAENAQARAAAQANPELVAVLNAKARRSGQSEVDWVEYFRNTGINHP